MNVIKSGRGFVIYEEDINKSKSTNDGNEAFQNGGTPPTLPKEEVHPVASCSRNTGNDCKMSQTVEVSHTEETDCYTINQNSMNLLFDNIKEMVNKKNQQICEQLLYGKMLKSQLAENYKLIAEHAMETLMPTEASVKEDPTILECAMKTNSIPIKTLMRKKILEKKKNGRNHNQELGQVPLNKFTKEVHFKNSTKTKMVIEKKKYKL